MHAGQFFSMGTMGNVRHIGKPICCTFPIVHSEKTDLCVSLMNISLHEIRLLMTFNFGKRASKVL